LNTGCLFGLLAIFIISFPLLADEGDGVSKQTGESASVAVQLTRENAAQYLMGGLDAQGGTGDWFLSNGVVCAVISDRHQESAITYQGGFLSDLGYCGRDDDHFVAMYPSLQLSLANVPSVHLIETAVLDGKAQIRTVAKQNGVQVSTIYSLTPQAPNVLSIQTEIVRLETGDPIERYGDILLTAHSMPMYDVSINRQSVSSGFAHIENAISPADLTVLIGAGDPGHNILYGYQPVSAELFRGKQEALSLSSFDMGGTEFP
jgi:hypothetical protein